MMKPKETFQKLTAHVKTWEWVVLLIAFTIPLLSFLYGDTNSIIRCGIDVLKSIVSGNFGKYYDYGMIALDKELVTDPPTYDILFYLTVGVWEIPVAIAEIITGTYVQDSSLAMCYSKLILLVFLCLSGWMVYKIAKQVGLSEKLSSWSAFMYMSGGFIAAYLAIAGQYDIMGLFFTLVGVYYYLKGDTKRFVIWFSIAVQYKFFPLFLFIPLVLLKEKKIWKILVYMVTVMIPTAIMRLPFLDNLQALEAKNEIQADMVDRILRNRIAIFETEIPLSFLFLGAVCLFCYWKDVKENEKNYYAIYVPFLAMGALFLSFPFFPYWIIYLTPWMALLFFMRKEKAERRFMFELGMTVCILIAQFSHFEWIFELDNMVNMLLDRLVFAYESFTNPLSLSNFNTILPVQENEPILYGMYVICLVAMLISYWPKENSKMQEDSYPCRKMMWIRFIISYGVGLIPLLLYMGSIVRQIIFG